MFAPQIEYIDAVEVPYRTVRKLVWNGTEFVPILVYRIQGHLKDEVHQWLRNTYGPRGQYLNGRHWDHYEGKFTVMDEKVYMFYKLKWEGR
jgi:hypothetical protein